MKLIKKLARTLLFLGSLACFVACSSSSHKNNSATDLSSEEKSKGLLQQNLQNLNEKQQQVKSEFQELWEYLKTQDLVPGSEVWKEKSAKIKNTLHNYFNQMKEVQ